MASLNKVLLIGNLTRDPEKRFTPAGMAVCDASIAINRKFKASNGEWKEEVCFVDVTLWGKTAENAVEYKRKGDPIFVEGRLRLDKWEKDGQKHQKLRVDAERIEYLPRGQSAGAGGGGGGSSGGGGAPRRAEYGDAPDSGEPWQGGGEAMDEGAHAPAPRAAPAQQGGGEKPDDLPF